MAAVISYPYLYHVDGSVDILDTYNQIQFTPQGSFGSATIQNSHIAVPPPNNDSVILYSANNRVSFGGHFMYVGGNIVPGDSFTVYSTTGDDTSSINWFLIAETSSTSFPNKTVFLPWYDNSDPTQICGKVTLDNNGQATITSKYLTNLTEQVAISRILLTLNTPFINDVFPTFTLENYVSLTGTFTITASEGTIATNATVNYFILTKNNDPYIPVSGSGTTIKLISQGAGPTYGIENIVASGPYTVNTTAVEANSIIIACFYTTTTDRTVKVVYVQSSDIVPGVSFKITFGPTLPFDPFKVSWLIVKPVGVP